MGGWSYPDISLEDLIKLVKGFVDILILASGYLSSGRFANWDPQNIKKAFQWGLFFENVLGHLDDYQDCTEELDAALAELTSNPYFPQGLKHLSSATLSRGRKFILEHLIHTLPLRDPHMKAFVEAVIEIDLDELQKTENNCLHVYLDKLNLQIAASNPRKGIMDDSPFTCQDNVSHIFINGDFTMSAIQEIMRRDVSASCISSAELGLSSLSKIASPCSQRELDSRLILEQQKQATALVPEERLIDSLSWRTRNLSYLLDKRTIRLVSGADMIFSAPKVQWVQIFERLNMSGKTEDDLLETIELLLLGLISSRWSPLLEHFTLICNDMNNSLTICTIYHEVHTLLLERFKNFYSKEEMKSSKEQGILEYLEVLLSHQLHQLWKLSPILVAMSLPSWSLLFRLYLNELGGQFKGKSPANRCCSCFADNHEHRDCEVAERIWCLYIFHVRGSHLMLGANLA